MTDNAFVGRQRELAILEKALNHAQQGHTQFVFLRGDGGSGKTTLIDQFCRQCEPLVISAHGMSLPFLECGEAYFPFLDLLSKLAAIKPPGDEKEPGFSDYSKAFVKALVDNGEDLVGTLLPSGSGVVKMVKSANKLWGDTKKQVSGDASIASSASIDTNKIHMQYARVLQSIAKKYPLVLCLDSFHWADMASLDMLIYLASNIKNSRILFVLALNDYEVPRSTDGNLMNSVYRLCTSSNHHWIDLNQGSYQEKKDFVTELLSKPNHNFSPTFLDGMLTYTNANPFFIKELISHLKEHGQLIQEAGIWRDSAQVKWDQLPRSAGAVIEERILRLSKDAQQLLSYSSVEGISFSSPVLAELSGIEESQLIQKINVEVLRKSHLVQEVMPYYLPDGHLVSRYQFINGLLREFLYSSLSMAERLTLHGKIAAKLEHFAAGSDSSFYNQVAYHYQQANNLIRAMEFYHKSAKELAALGAYKDALAVIEKAIEILKCGSIEPTPHEVFNIYRDAAYLSKVVRGWGVLETHKHLESCIKLAQQHGYQKEILPIIYGLWGFHLFQNNIDKSLTVAERLLKISQSNQLQGIEQSQAFVCLANSHYWRGNLQDTERYLAEFARHYQPKHNAELIASFGETPEPIHDMFICLLDIHRCNFQSAYQDLHKVEQKISSMAANFSKAIHGTTLVWAAILMEDCNLAKQGAQTLDAIIDQYGIDSYRIYSLIGQGYHAFCIGDFESAMRCYKESERLSVSTGQPLMSSMRIVKEIELDIANQEYNTARLKAEASLIRCEELGEHIYISEFKRLLARALQFQNNMQESEQHLRSAISEAQKQNNKLMEHKATADLIDLMMVRGTEQSEEYKTLKHHLETELAITAKPTTDNDGGPPLEASLLDLL